MNIKELLENKYATETFESFISDRFGAEIRDTDYDDSELNQSEKQHIRDYRYLGKVQLDDGKEIGFFEFRSHEPNIENKRVGYNAILKKLALMDVLDGAIASFFHEDSDAWRLSFVGFEYDAGKVNVTNLKRYTYVLGAGIPTKTAYGQLKDLKYPKFYEIQNAFNVEAVGKAFFEEYKKLFELVNTNLKSQTGLFESEENLHAYSKKLLGRIVFLYFLQKKGWLGVKEKWGDGDKKFLENLYKNKPENFYAKVLNPLFFDTLNLKRQDDYSDIFACKIPFLNGGLFDKNSSIDDNVFIDDNIFGDIFDVFNRYNFTIIEGSMDDAEVAIDPEMLGRVFENLLEDNYRKGKGAFYTPREIVHYMCQSSIEKYLENKSDHLQAIKTVKVLDPAIGSGAFPMGMLHEIVQTRLSLEDKTPLADLKREIIENSIYGVDIDGDAVEIAKLRFWISLTVDEDVPSPLPNLDFKIMQGNSLIETINGFDIIPSDIYEKTEKKPKDLFDSQEQTLLDEKLFDILTKKIHEFYGDTTGAKKQSDKTEIKNLINQIINSYLDEQEYRYKQSETMLAIGVNATSKKKISDALVTLGDNIDTARRVLAELLKNNFQTKELFLYKLFFGEVLKEGGFDIVIGNPPYVQLQKFGEDIKKKLQIESFETFERTGDIYCLFYEQGIKLLKENGILCYITSNKWMRAGYGESLRGFFAKKTNPLILIDFAGQKIFETATVDTNILICEKSKNIGKTTTCIVKTKFDNLSNYIAEHKSENSFMTSDSWTILNPIEQRIKEKIERIGTPLKDWDISIYRGILTGFNDAFIIDGKKKDELIAEDPKSAEIIRPILRGRDIKRY
ncbi:MAG: Eco57I restriction-modification methylase domain-containing protein, partial [Sulfurovaceae bacterium]|nr:Eco57I restriction-modification methylase domain-containing protein [Sulfurovaceae bacterium]